MKTTGTGDSLWLVPKEPELSRFNILLSQLADKFKGPQFTAHITLFPGLEIDDKILLAQCNEIKKGLEPFEVKFSGLQFTDNYFKCVFAPVASDSTLNTLYQKTVKYLQVSPRREFMPHLSLFYGSLDSSTKEKIKSEVQEEMPTSISIGSLEIVSTRGEVSEWVSKERFALK